MMAFGTHVGQQSSKAIFSQLKELPLKRDPCKLSLFVHLWSQSTSPLQLLVLTLSFCTIPCFEENALENRKQLAIYSFVDRILCLTDLQWCGHTNGCQKWKHATRTAWRSSPKSPGSEAAGGCAASAHPGPAGSERCPVENRQEWEEDQGELPSWHLRPCKGLQTYKPGEGLYRAWDPDTAGVRHGKVHDDECH